MASTDPATLTDQLVDRFDHIAPGITPAISRDALNRLREHPTLPHTDAHGGYYLVLNHADVLVAQRGATTDCPVFSYAQGTLQPVHENMARNIPIDFDGSKHSRYRKIFTDLMNLPTLKANESTIREVVDRRVDPFVTAGGGDFVASVGSRVPIDVMGDLIGWGPEVREQVHELSGKIMDGFETDGLPPGILELAALMQGVVDETRACPAGNYMQTITELDLDGSPLADSEITNILRTFLFASYETTNSMAGHLALRLATNHDLQSALRDDPSLIPAAVEETVRMTPPVHMQFRSVERDVELRGVALRPGDRVGIAWIAANYDPEVFESPDEFRLDRPNGRHHVGFGFGAHLCAGIHLARLELIGLFEQLLARTSEFSLDGDPVFEPMRIAHDSGLKSLPLRVIHA